MATFHSILCPVDFSPHSALALRYAAALADMAGATLTVVWVQDVMLTQAAAVYTLDPKGDDARAELNAFVAEALPPGISRPSAMDLVVTVGTAERDILKIARTRRADLIVMGTHGLSGYQKMFFGSTTERVLRHTSIPVLAVPRRDESTPASVEGSVLRGPVVVAVDLGHQSQMLIDAGSDIAKALQAPVVIVHVVEARSAPARWRPAVAAQQQTEVTEAQQALGRLHVESAEGGVEPVVVAGRPADHIAALAETRRAAVIVMGLIRDRGRIGARPGSIAYRVLTLAPAPVLVIPPSAQARA
jgi:nucleotide-binding universal stress UspA family protein